LFPNNYPEMTDNLIKSVEKYLGLFGSKDSFTTENALTAMRYHYQDIRMTDFYLNAFPNEEFILSFDYLSISIYTKAFNYLKICFIRSFKFLNDTETVKIELELDFENIKDDSKYENWIELSKNDLAKDELLHENKINEIENDIFFKKVKNQVPIKYALKINYDV